MCEASLENSVVQIPTHCHHTHTHTHIPSPCRVCPGKNPQVANLPTLSEWLGAGAHSSPLPCARALPTPGGSQGGAGPLTGGPSPGAVRGPGGGEPAGLGAGRAGAGVSLPPSLSPVKSRGAAGLSPVSSSCSLGRAAVTVHRRRRGLHRRVRPPASMATTTTCTRFTDDYQLFEELGKYGRPLRPPTLPPPPGRYAAPCPAPGPALVAAAPPWPAPPPAFPARRL